MIIHKLVYKKLDKDFDLVHMIQRGNINIHHQSLIFEKNFVNFCDFFLLNFWEFLDFLKLFLFL